MDLDIRVVLDALFSHTYLIRPQSLGYETISGTFSECVLCFACTCTVLPP